MWTPKNGSTTLDSVSTDVWKNFPFVLKRNGHAVSFFMTLESADKKRLERAAALPNDTWEVSAR